MGSKNVFPRALLLMPTINIAKLSTRRNSLAQAFDIQRLTKASLKKK